MRSLLRGCRCTIAQASCVYLKRRWLPSFSLGCFASRTSPDRATLSLSVHSSRQISASRLADAIANCTMSPIGITERRSRARKNSASLINSSGVGRRVRFLDFPMSRNSRHAFRASSTQRGSTGRARTLFAARSTTPIHVRSLATVAGPAPPARRARTWSTNMGVVRRRALLSPIGCRSRNSRWVCLLRCHFEIVSNESIYQRMSSASDGAPCVTRINAVGSSSATSRARAHFSAADRNSKVFDSRWTMTPFFLIRILARVPDPGTPHTS